MKILVAGQEYHVDRTQENVIEYIFSIIKATMAEKTMTFCGVRIDGREVYKDFEEEIAESIETIETIEPILMTEEELAKETLLSIKDYTSRSIEYLNGLAYHFQTENVTSETWEDLGKLVEGLMWIQNTTPFYPEYETLFTFTSEMETINTAVIQQDTGLLGDMIEYEIIPRYQAIQEALEDIGSQEVNGNGAN
ncbi:hypothetical protein NST23_25690 [Brevibacillus sp. FSL K6-0770]|uniref:hypothetical protein n=1 Tax=Brevibacillus TaxID=55080 RepID=UPI000ECEE128|nr:MULTISPECIES: hypothetical protein [Brevibacillus]MDH6350878.1 disulfide oxidoreductase YuzD [Brevibacillus sp. 1238]MDR4997924.1 hypothetical protein [Brevibacillus parabrevis]NRQ53467.1 hypothetical protein [Brevibacillus sp. HD1.4A]HBZ81757.1 hypothetical protein [Brevibacillus sp.]